MRKWSVFFEDFLVSISCELKWSYFSIIKGYSWHLSNTSLLYFSEFYFFHKLCLWLKFLS
uniref:Uncharacterized protein n=1 Tax=Myoviridae sp. ctBtT5 TaxID=2825048 RepID=A0A8S5PY08_9CAUD|nr:MAG TPA: hypothetical protein [Myoviridae sp. ctBtT5]